MTKNEKAKGVYDDDRYSRDIKKMNKYDEESFVPAWESMKLSRS